MIKTKNVTCQKFDTATLKASLVTVSYAVEDTFTAYNLEIHQITELANLRVLSKYVDSQMADGSFEKGEVQFFLRRLIKNSAKIDYAVRQIESTLDVGKTLTFDIEA